ncbi:MAG: tetratricopeptide repeat protein [Elusimicrobia bacterium]|nr:tetratricopeptide repeat protein [Elusimicrobiota bacterium]
MAALCCASLRLASVIGADAIVDEAVYAADAGVLYADYLRRGELGLLIRSRENYEHPPLVKLIYGAVIAATGNSQNPEGALRASRWVSAVLTSAQAALLCLLSPIAAVLFCVHTQQILYSSKAYLDGPSSFFALAAAFLFLRAKRAPGGGLVWGRPMALSAVFLGAAMASKYINAVVAAPIALLLLQGARRKPKTVALYGAVSAAAFVLFDPAIWSNPVGHLLQSLRFHDSIGDTVRYRMYVDFMGREPRILDHFNWLLRNREFPFLLPLPQGTDALVLILSFGGLPYLFRRSALLGWWYVAGAAFLLLYRIKFPHYTLVFIPPMALAAAEMLDPLTPLILRARGRSPSAWTWPAADAAAAVAFAGLSAYGLAYAWTRPPEKTDMLEAEICYGLAQLQLGRRDEAERYFRKTLDRPAGRARPTAHMALSSIFQDLGYLPEAEAEARQAYRERPNHYSTHMRLGDVLLVQGKSKEALVEYLAADHSTIVDPRHRAVLFMDRARAYLALKDFAGAQGALTTAAALNPENETIRRHQEIVAERLAQGRRSNK